MEWRIDIQRKWRHRHNCFFNQWWISKIGIFQTSNGIFGSATTLSTHIICNTFMCSCVLVISLVFWTSTPWFQSFSGDTYCAWEIRNLENLRWSEVITEVIKHSYDMIILLHTRISRLKAITAPMSEQIGKLQRKKNFLIQLYAMII